jgi:protein involved in polysaccharide export with SLBB domain
MLASLWIAGLSIHASAQIMPANPFLSQSATDATTTSLPTQALTTQVGSPAVSAPPSQAAPAPAMPSTSPPAAVAPTAPVKVFGGQLFGGNFRATLNPGFNPEYQVAIGDRLQLKLWGGVSFDGSVLVDAKGNIFVPNVGPVAVAGVSNGDLSTIVEAGVRKIIKAGTGVYAALDVSQPVKVFVTGYVRQPGLYSGVASDSVVSYLDKAGGVDPERGSYVDVVVKRGGKVRKHINLYSFLLDGNLDLVQFQDGDVIVIGPRIHTFSVGGDVFNSYDFEFSEAVLPLRRALEMAKIRPDANHVSVVRGGNGSERRSEYYSISDIDAVSVNDGDTVAVFSDRYPATIQVRIDGAHSGEHAMVLPYGATLQDVLSKITPNVMSRLDSVYLLRRSVVERQKEMLTTALQKLGLDADSYGELLAVVGLYNQFNKLVDALQVDPDVMPDPAWPESR